MAPTLEPTGSNAATAVRRRRHRRRRAHQRPDGSAGLLVDRVGPIPAAVLLELDALALVVLVLRRDVVASLAGRAFERDVNSLVVCHSESSSVVRSRSCRMSGLAGSVAVRGSRRSVHAARSGGPEARATTLRDHTSRHQLGSRRHCHRGCRQVVVRFRRTPTKNGGTRRRASACASSAAGSAQEPGGEPYLRILVTRPAPTVRPPSRIANRNPSSIAIGAINSTCISVLSPGMHISVPAGNVILPVTSVVRK